MNDIPHVTGHEGEAAEALSAEFSKFSKAEIDVDKFGNMVARLKGNGGPKVMLSAHMDEIGMMVSVICDDGFVKFSCIGGIDKRNILAQEVTIHGREKVYGVIGIKPPHLIKAGEEDKSIDIFDMSIDTGYSKEKLEALIRPGDIITIKQEVAVLQNNRIAAKALDDMAGVAVLYQVAKNLEHYSHIADVYLVASTQEEVGLRGAVTSTYNIKPDIGIAIDVGFGRANGLGEHESVEIGKGPSICIGPNINRKLYEELKNTAVNNNTPYQVEVSPFTTGTDAGAIQMGEGGVITALLSVPLKYMHSTVETISLKDIESCAKLISDYIIGVNNGKWEETLCF